MPVFQLTDNFGTAAGVDSTGEYLEISKLAEGLSTDLLVAAGQNPTFADLGLGGWTPAGLFQTGLNELHQLGQSRDIRNLGEVETSSHLASFDFIIFPNDRSRSDVGFWTLPK